MDLKREQQEKVKNKMKEIARMVDNELPENFGFVVLAFPFGENEQNRLQYVANAQREDVINAMKEFIQKTEDNYGKDI